MNKIRLIVLACVPSLLLFSVAFPFSQLTTSQTKLSAFRSQAKSAQVGPLDLSGELHGAPYRIRVPAVWNGTLLVFAHGYRQSGSSRRD